MVTVNNKQLCENCFRETTTDPCPYCGFSKSTHKQDPITLAIGSILNQRYMIGGVIGKGGFGITYLAYDLKLDTRLAVKEYYPMGMAIRTPGTTVVSVSNEQSEEPFKKGAEKFYSEAKMVAKFNGNPNIVSVHDFFYENDTVYFTMGYLEGETLKTYLKNKKLTEGQAVKIMQDISNGLLASHSMNILHRDISPDNIMLCDDGSVKLLDFGAARQVMAEQSQSLSVILKQGFAPLEQYQKKGRQGPWTDIYALGATIYHALTGDILDDPMTRLEDDSAFENNKHGISEGLWKVIHKSLSLKIEDRYQDVFELKRDLNALDIKPEPIYDVKEELFSAMGRTAKAFGSTEEDSDATMLLSGQGDSGTGGNETMALTPQQAAAYAGPVTGQPQEPVTGQPVVPVPKPQTKQAVKSRTNIILTLAPAVTWVLAVIFLISGVAKFLIYRNDPANQIITETEHFGGLQKEEDPVTYKSDTYKYSMDYNADEYSDNEVDSNLEEFINEDGSHHMAVKYMDADDDGIIVYDGQDYADRIEARNDLLLPKSSYGDLEVLDYSESTNSKGEELKTYTYSFTDDDENKWLATLDIADSAGDYGCYLIYSIVLDEAENRDYLISVGEDCVDTFIVTDAADSEDYYVYTSDEYGIELSTTTESEAQIGENGVISVHFDPEGTSRYAGIFPGELYGDSYESMFKGIADVLYSDLTFSDDMYPVIHGRYNGYMCSTTWKDGDETYYGLFMALTTQEADSKYKTYVIVIDDTEKDLDYLIEIADGFRFYGAPIQDLSGIDGSEATPLKD